MLNKNTNSSGFTLIELVVSVLIIGILSAIAAPSWMSFVNQQRVNAVNDVVFRALQSAQQQAKSKKVSYSVSFKTEDTPEGKVPKIAIHPSDTTPVNWESLGKDLVLNSWQFLLGTNLTSENTATSSLSYALNTEQTITFDYTGSLPPPPETNLGNKGLIVAVAVPQSGNSAQAAEATTRCVIVQTLLGTMRTAKGTDCNSSS